MKTSSFLAALRTHATLPLVFRAGREIVPPGYHLTEVKRVAYETIDCGAMAHDWSETQFEIWAPPQAGITPDREHMVAEKFLRIIDRVEAALPLKSDVTARIHASFDGQPAALYDIDDASARDGKLWIELSGDRTRCKAAERRSGSRSGGCCGVGPDQSEQAETSAGCSCGSAKTETTAAACCS